MTIRLSVEAVERSTYKIAAAIADAAGAPTAPASAVWSLRDSVGSIVNGRSDVPFTPLASELIVLLSGDDLALSGDGDDCIRFVTVEAVYSSDEGSNLPLNGEVSFKIARLLGVS